MIVKKIRIFFFNQVNLKCSKNQIFNSNLNRLFFKYLTQKKSGFSLIDTNLNSDKKIIINNKNKKNLELSNKSNVKNNIHVKNKLFDDLKKLSENEKIKFQQLIDEKYLIDSQQQNEKNYDFFLFNLFNFHYFIETNSTYEKLRKANFSLMSSSTILDLIITLFISKINKLEENYLKLKDLDFEKSNYEISKHNLKVEIVEARRKHNFELINLMKLIEIESNNILDDINSDSMQMKNSIQVLFNDQKSDNTLQSKSILLKIQEANRKINTELNSSMRSEIESLRWYLSTWGLVAIIICVFSGCTIFYSSKRSIKKNEKLFNFFNPLTVYDPKENHNEKD